MTTEKPMITRRVPISSLVPDPANVRKHGAKNMAAIKGSIAKFGQVEPLVVQRKTSIVIGGNGRLAAMIELGMTEVDIVEVDMGPAEAAALGIALNRTGELAEWDQEALAKALTGLDSEGFALAEIGFDVGDLEEMLPEKPGGDADAEPQIDKAEELREKWGVETGQLWELGDHWLLCGDSAKAEDVARVICGGTADMMITDPPYGVAYVGKTKNALTVENDDVDEATLAAMCKQWFDRADEATRPGAYWIATVPAGPLHGVFFFDWKSRGYLRQVMVWNKDSMVLGHSEYHYKHEPILFGWKPGDRLKNDDRTKTTVWDFPRPKASREHPTMKPVEMWAYAVKNHTKAGDTVYEPFSGSGTTIIVCEQLGRKCRAIEISPGYVAVALQRWADATGKTPKPIK